MAARLAERERESVLGRLAATVAHEVRNPLGGMTTALDTVRKFGDNPDVRGKSLDLIERGLWSIRNVVGSVLAFHRMPPDTRRLAQGDLDDLRLLIEPGTGPPTAPTVLAQQRPRNDQRRCCDRDTASRLKSPPECLRSFTAWW